MIKDKHKQTMSNVLPVSMADCIITGNITKQNMCYTNESE